MTIANPSARVIGINDSTVYSIGSGNFDTFLKLATGDVTGTVSIVEHTLRPHTLAAPLHRHTHEDEITYVIAGELTLLQDGELSIARAGEYVTKPRGMWHTFWNATDETVRMIEIIVPGGFEQYFAELETIILPDAAPDMAALIALGARYGLTFDLGSMPELLAQYQLRV